MKLFKKTIAILALVALSVSAVACGTSGSESATQSQQKEGDVVAKVGDVSIYMADVDAQMMQMEYYMQLYYGEDFKSNAEVMEQYYAYRDNVVSSLVEAEILVLKAKENKDINVTDKEIEEELEVTKASFTSEETFNTALEQSGMTLDELKENIEKNLYVNKLIEYYSEKTEVTTDEIQAYYDTNIANYTTQAGANIAHILVETEETANEVLEKYNSGTSFEDLAAEYGTDGTKDAGGALGYIPYATTSYDADFMAGAKLVAEGEVSVPVETQFGWHLIKVEDIQAEDIVQTLTDVEDEIKAELAYNKATEELTALLVEWRNDYTIEIFEDVLTANDTAIEEETTDTTAEASPEASASN